MTHQRMTHRHLAAASGLALLCGALAVAGYAVSSETAANAAEHKGVINSNTVGKGKTAMTEIATFGAGCFWGVEATFRKLDGVTDTAVGYCGGKTENPTYKEVCSDSTGHAEVVQVTFDPSVISYDKLLDVFWASHDPTLFNRQGPDVGSQYRSAIFTHSPQQVEQARASKARADASGKFRSSIKTVIEDAKLFWKAEEYHQQYLEKRGQDSCHF